ncbi:electron transfer flavoprotein subunit beta/FixA family protein [Mahella australiensis]|uniref:Electron transfer flavoprotein small subunit n=1 Tax=Mahella australiensis (strain DSM 15567 / CIP 107919 / 50-1 BON) TaxID=697281 RepID=F3ZWR9_MAHA5|nr:electron transfer flavoprotein subunit beta/FixA family protein [Mahella australiensis]AEE96512.1 Electron transfer flavoprotein alpha/beta-subunit [Mahella australiensis 50-1 BON]
MNIIVCIKQVPATNDVKINKDTNTLVRDEAQSVINPFDTYAVEEGVRLKEATGGKITVISMGIPKVADILKECIAVGADDGILLSDRAFAGADTLATSAALAAGINKIGDYDIIICGKQAIDGDTGQVGPELAERLGIPHITCVRKIEEIKEDYIRAQRMTDFGYEVIECSLPAVITVVKEINEPRLPSIKGMMKAKKAVIPVWTADDVGADKDKIGLRGSPTKVIKTFTPEININTEIIDGTPEEQAHKLVEKLLQLQIKVPV